MNRIVHLIFAMEVGGAENLLVDVANDQVRYSSVAIIIVNRKYDQSVIRRIAKSIKIIYIDRKEGQLDLIGILKIWKWLLVLKPEIIHCHQHKLIRFLPFWRKKTVMTVHDVGIPTINLKKYKKIFAISAAVQQDLLKRGQIHSCIVRNGIVVEDIRCKRAYLFNYDKSYKIVQISRLYHEKKGQHIAIQALGKLHEAGYSNLNLYFIGNGPSLEYLKKLAKELHLEQNIFFLGIRERSWIYKNLFSFDLLVQPSLYEGFGLTVIEGIAAGLPVIASKSGGPEEILADIPSGFLFNAMDQWDLVAAIKNVIDLTVQNQIEQRCVISREIVCQSFSISQTATDYLLAYSDIQRRKGLSRTVV